MSSKYFCSIVCTGPLPPMTFVVQEKGKASCAGSSVSDVINLISWSASEVCLLTDFVLSYLAGLYYSPKILIYWLLVSVTIHFAQFLE